MNKDLKNALSEVKKEIVATENIDDQQDELDARKSHIILDLEDRKEKRRSRRLWGKVLLGLVVAGFSTSYIIVILIGCRVLNYPENAFAVPSVVAAGIIGTYSLAKIAVKYFFSD